MTYEAASSEGGKLKAPGWEARSEPERARNGKRNRPTKVERELAQIALVDNNSADDVR